MDDAKGSYLPTSGQPSIPDTDDQGNSGAQDTGTPSAVTEF